MTKHDVLHSVHLVQRSLSVACLLCAKVGKTIQRQAFALLRDVRLLAGSASRAGNRGLSILDNVVYTSLLHARPTGRAKMGDNPRKGSSVRCAAGGASARNGSARRVLGVRAPGAPKQGQREGVCVGCGFGVRGVPHGGHPGPKPGTMHEMGGARH